MLSDDEEMISAMKACEKFGIRLDALTDDEKKKRIDELIGEVERGEYKFVSPPNHGEKREPPDYNAFEEYVQSDFVKSLSEL